MKLRNNNIQYTSDLIKGKVFHGCLNHVIDHIKRYKSKFEEKEVVTVGVFDKLRKGTVKVKQFAGFGELDQEYIDRFVEGLEKGFIVKEGVWNFKLV